MTFLRPLYQPVIRKVRRRRSTADGSMIRLHRPTSEEARIAMAARLGETAFLADWIEVVFLHFEVERELLQAEVPFPIDTFQGRAYFSLVAFTIRRMRPAIGGKATRWLTAPIAHHQFLNLRTYVTHGETTGIFFQREWLNNRVAVALGPSTFGLPYRFAEIDYCYHADRPAGTVSSEKGRIRYEARRLRPPREAEAGSREAFLLERYTAFADAGNRPTSFRVWHEPWRFCDLGEVRLQDTSLLDEAGFGWTKGMRFVGGQASAGVKDVWMGRPHRIRR